jgi:hypothetical protein
MIFSHLPAGLDPENQEFDNNRQQWRTRVSAASGPAARLFSFGINLDF